MADSKITALTAISTVDPAADPLVIVDVSDTSMAASGTTKKATINQLLGASGTATLASATITGDLTVDTNVLKVDSANNRVGIGTASPTAGMALDIVSATSNNFVRFTDGVNATGYLGVRAANGAVYLHANNNVVSLSCSTSNTTPTEQLRITNPGVFEFLDGAGGTRMTLNSTGLGVGVTPLASHLITSQGPVAISGTGGGTRTSYISNTNACSIYYTDGGGSGFFADFGNLIIQPRTSAGRSVVIATSAAAGTPVERLIVDPSGNVGIGVTPSGTIYSVSETRLVVKGTSNNFAGTLAVQSKGTTNAVTGFLTASDNTNEVAVGSTTNSPLNFYTNNALKATIDASGNLILLSSATPATLTTNGQLTVNATSNTNLRFSYRGSDGVTRVANITLA